MAEDLNIQSDTREGRYRELIPQLKALLQPEDDLVANLANTCAALKTALGFFWVGFYLVKDDTLVLGPFQGPVACTRIARGKGVCGTAWQNAATIVVPDVDAFPGHIACSSASRSEIVLPVIRNGRVVAVLDVDSDLPDDFSATDERYLSEILQLIKFDV